MCISSHTMLALKPTYPTEVKMMTTALPDDSKRRRLNLKKQQEAYKTAMADSSQIYDGRDMMPDYSSKFRDSGAFRAELKALSSFYRPVKNCQEHNGKAYPSSRDTADTQTSPIERSCAHVKHNDQFSRNEHSISPTDHSLSDSKASITHAIHKATLAMQVQSSEFTPCDTTSTSVASEDSESSSSLKLIRRKKSSPQHRCIDKNLKLSGIMKPPRYLPSQLGDHLGSSLKINRDEKVYVDERLTKSMVEFRANVEVYCYTL
ncbi:hypothetical protein ACHAW6_007304 [Cyclotella cf. meneghiniana]